MEKSEYFQHHGLRPDSRPFDNSNDAKQDTVFKSIMESTRHPNWGKYFGEAGTPSSAIIFGRRGSGKTALRLQMAREMTEYNRKAREAGKSGIQVIQYLDFNPFQAEHKRRLGKAYEQVGFSGRAKALQIRLELKRCGIYSWAIPSTGEARYGHRSPLHGTLLTYSRSA